MTYYIENIFICLAIPLILSLLFRGGKDRKFTFFVIVGMGMCLLSAYVSSFLAGYYRADTAAAIREITPVCEEVMKFLPLLIYLAVFEPRNQEIVPAALGIAVGFATFENVCFLAENGVADFSLLLIRGISAGAFISYVECAWIQHCTCISSKLDHADRDDWFTGSLRCFSWNI